MKEKQLSKNIYEKINVSLNSRSYDIYIGHKLIENSYIVLKDFLINNKIIILYDQNVFDKFNESPFCS